MVRSIPHSFQQISLVALFCLLAFSASATHNRAGEITYEQIDRLTVRATITTYTKASSRPADRDSLELCWGDGDCEWVLRSNGTGTLLPNDTKFNIYIAEHTYSTQGHFIMTMTDPNRSGGILNVNPPSSDNVPFHLRTTVTLFNPQFAGFNNSPVLLQPPIDIACAGQPFIHNPNAYDPDGDSLSYELVVPLQSTSTNVPNYSFPNQIQPGAANNIGLDPVTGDFDWITPQLPGEYNIAMYIIQHRNGRPVDTLIRDLQILVEMCDNRPPIIETVTEVCVIAGETLRFDVTATAPLTAPDDTQKVALTALGGPLIQDISPAKFIVADGYQDDPLVGVFEWETACEHISDQFYSVVFRAVDNFEIIDDSGDRVFLSTLKTVRIKVVGPPPQDVQAVAEMGEVEVTWEKPYSCENAQNEFFRGFSVWRREGSNLFPPDSCQTGLAGQGYTRLNAVLTTEMMGNRYFYLDMEVERGRTYCYRILAEFAKTSLGGNPFNPVESLPSEEFCVQLSRDIPLLTNASVEQTDANNGEVQVRWVLPDPEDLDTLQNPGPYRYELLRAPGITDVGFQLLPGAIFTTQNFLDPVPTEFLDTDLATSNIPYTYQIAFYVNGETEPLGIANEASTIFLSVASTDNQNDLSWEELVPWENFEYVVYRQNASGIWDSIGVSETPEFSDTGLNNGQEYCYYVESKGTYGIDEIPGPLLNKSQEACGIPLDTIPPCPPVLRVTNICNDPGNRDNCEPGNLINDLSWTDPKLVCADTDDAIAFNIYYTAVEGGNFEIIASFDSTSFDTVFTHMPDLGLAGCYAVTALDTFNNESAFSNIVCVDNCPIYELPNVFTPNGDGENEMYIPLQPFCFIDRIELTVVNRWGQTVFQTNDPEIRWDGKNLSGKPLAEGVYYYTCKVFENRVTGISPRTDLLKGYIHLVRGE
ncbi:MAG: gliding motility-associated C-terminal domain-containing protein [Bacteroidota bacterium]